MADRRAQGEPVEPYMRLALCQIDPVIGAFDRNVDEILKAADRAAAERPDLIVFPELSLSGYPPMDLLGLAGFAGRDEAAFRRLQRALPAGVAVAVGHIGRNETGLGRPHTNAISVILDGRVVFSQAKTLLPTYDVFDEARYFEPARERRVWRHKGVAVGFAVCEDLWSETEPVPGMRYPIDPPRELLDAGAELIVVPSASPFHAGKQETSLRLASNLAREGSVPVLYCNLAGATDSLVFDGRSFALDASGDPIARAGWEEGLTFVDTEAAGTPAATASDASPCTKSRNGPPHCWAWAGRARVMRMSARVRRMGGLSGRGRARA